MRRLFVALGLFASITGASAQEYEIPTLRGTDSYVPDAPGPMYQARWSGFYVGVQVGVGIASADFTQSSSDLIAHMLRNSQLQDEQVPSDWTVFGKSDTRSGSAGAFMGYNIGWEDLILGAEINYNRSNLNAGAPVFPIERVVTVGSNFDDVTLSGSATMRITEHGTARLRAGYVTGNFMPYGFVGFAFGRADAVRSATATVIQTPIGGGAPVTVNFSESDVKNGAFIYGWAAGLGVEVMIMPKVFLRGEYEYAAFQPLFGVNAQIQTGRAAIGYKF
jgi:opacity protein-like surface antigen